MSANRGKPPLTQNNKTLRALSAFAVQNNPENPVNPVKKTMKIAAISPQPFVHFVAFCKMLLDIGGDGRE
jgi:hypothetical protein